MYQIERSVFANPLGFHQQYKTKKIVVGVWAVVVHKLINITPSKTNTTSNVIKVI
jgi:hypothetical protein